MRASAHRLLPVYAGVVTLVGWCALLYGALAWHETSSTLDGWWIPAFAVAIILGECFPVRLWGTDGEATVSQGFSLALLWLAGPVPVLLIQAAAVGAAELASRRRKPRRMMFNIAQLSLAWMAAAFAMDLVGGQGSPLVQDSGTVVLAIVAMTAGGAAYSVVNMLLTGAAAALATGKRLIEVLSAYARVELITGSLLTGFAPVIAAIVQEAPLLLPLLGFPLAAVRFGGNALARSERDAMHDALTGLPNRAHVRLKLGELLRTGPVAVLFADLDRFKDVNDSLGHDVGDLLLRRIGEQLTAELPSGTHVARLAGDEFAVLAPGAGELEANELALKFHALLRDVPDVDGMRLDMGVSIGIALAPDHGDDPHVLFKRAEIAMYEAKQRRNATAVYRPGTDEAAAERLHLARDLRDAIAARTLDVHYQPKLDLRTGEVTGVEALARWTHPTRGPIPPGVFVPLAEAGGLIGELGSAVLEMAVAQVARWRTDGLDIKVAVNLSVRRLLDEGVVEEVAAVLARHDVPGSGLELEITESVFLDDPERAQVVLRELADLGVSLAVDDYGTGYSSLAYLRDLPVSTLKLDRAFVKGLPGSAADEAIVESTLVLARSLGLEVVAEGVEDDIMLRAVTRLGCQQAQGYHIGRPARADAVTAWLLARRDAAPKIAA